MNYRKVVQPFIKKSFLLISVGLYIAACPTAYAIDAIYQEPKNSSGSLVDFEPRMMDAPFIIKYPGDWHAREEYWGNAKVKVYFSREPVINDTDAYNVGVGLFIHPEFFGKSIPNFESETHSVEELFRKNGLVIQDKKKINLSGEPASEMIVTSPDKKAFAIAQRKSNHLFLIEMRAPDSEFEKYVPIFNQMLQSFRWQINPKKSQASDDPVMKVIIENKESDIVYNDKKMKRVKVGDFVKKWVDDEVH